jgi:hypothetical protein
MCCLSPTFAELRRLGPLLTAGERGVALVARIQVRITFLLTAVFAQPSPIIAHSVIPAEKAQVRFPATGAPIRNARHWKDDTYLAELNFPHSNESILIRLIDACPSEAPPISREVFESDAGAVLPVRRDAECDRPFGQILLRTAPGDPMAILPVKLEYQPLLSETIGPNSVLRCYRTVRR